VAGERHEQQRVVVAMRVTSSANMKHRPEWFSKNACILSVIESADLLRSTGGEVRTIALFDSAGGPADPELTDLLTRFDTVTEMVGGSARRSWKAMFDILKRDVADDSFDVIYLVEDDHLHHPDAITALAGFHGDFGLLYCIDYVDGGVVEFSDGFEWAEAISGVSSFAASRATYLRSRRLLRAMSNTNHAWDEVTWRAVLGPHRFSAKYVLWSFSKASPWAPWKPQAIWQFVWRLIGYVWSLLRKPSRLASVRPSLATHAEVDLLSAGRDWASVAKGVSSHD
jgi:hypothetical protein